MPGTASTSRPLEGSGPGHARPRAWLVVGVLVGLVHLAALYWPRVTVAAPVPSPDKLVHSVIFLVPLVAWSLWWGRWQPVAVVLAGHAVLSEVVQHVLLPHRTGDPWDAAVDLLGVALGVVVVAPLLRRRRRVAAGDPAPGAASTASVRW